MFACWTHACCKLGSQCTDSGGRYERYLRTASHCAIWVLFQCSCSWVLTWLHFAGRSKGKEEHHKPSSHVLGLSIQRHEYKGEKGACNHYTCDPLPASQSYWLSKGNDSLLNMLAQLDQGHMAVIPEGMPLEPEQMENFSFIDLLGTSWSLLKKLWWKVQSNRQWLYFYFKLQWRKGEHFV